MKVSTPHDSDSCDRTSGTGVKARIGMWLR